jgi:hypothetical protein
MERRLLLRSGDLIAVEGEASVAVSGGGTWITQYGDINDYYVRDGSWTAQAKGLVLVHAIDECQVALSGPAAAKARVSRRLVDVAEPTAPRRFAFA